MKFFYAAGMPILEGYGLTETSPVVSVNTFEHMKFGTVGRPILNVEVKIEPDPERPGRRRGDPGPRPQRHAGVLPPAGEDRRGPEPRTAGSGPGDIGILDADGFLAITDRKKDLIKTSGRQVRRAPADRERDQDLALREPGRRRGEQAEVRLRADRPELREPRWPGPASRGSPPTTARRCSPTGAVQELYEEVAREGQRRPALLRDDQAASASSRTTSRSTPAS